VLHGRAADVPDQLHRDNDNPIGTVTFSVGGSKIPGCVSVPLPTPPSGSWFLGPTAVCHTTFAAASVSPLLIAAYTPTPGSTWQSSSESDPLDLKGATNPPTLADYSATGVFLGLGAAQPAFQLDIGSSAQVPAITGATLTLPNGLSFTSSRAKLARAVRVVGIADAKVKARARSLNVTFHRATSTLKVSVSAGALKETKRLAKQARRIAAFNRVHRQGHSRVMLTVGVTVQSIGHAPSHLTAKLVFG
jgi:hypothetical protein